MKKFFIAFLAAATLGLAACNEQPTPEPEPEPEPVEKCTEHEDGYEGYFLTGPDQAVRVEGKKASEGKGKEWDWGGDSFELKATTLEAVGKIDSGVAAKLTAKGETLKAVYSLANVTVGLGKVGWTQNFQGEDGKIYKAMVFFGFGKRKNNFAKEMNKAFREQYPDVEFSWSLIVNEVTPKGCTKGQSIAYYCDHLGIDYNDVYVVGDSGNDITMFNTFKNNSFCMKHASKIVRKYATHTVGRIYQLEKYLLPKEEK